MAIRDFIDGMSDEQKAAAKFTSNPLLTLAGAGSGKTRMLMGRVAHLVNQVDQGGLGADFGSIMMVTFTNKAAREMRERIKPMMEELQMQSGGVFRGEPWIGTFHGLSLRILRIEADRAGLGRNFSIFDESDARALANDVVEEMGIDYFDVDEFFQDLEIAKARMLDPAFLIDGKRKVEEAETRSSGEPEIDRWKKILGHFESSSFIEIYERYQGALQEQNAVDFNDLLNRTTRLMQQNEEVRNSWRSTFRHFMVDEVQDINRAQVAWLMAMTDGGREMAIPENAKSSDYGDASDGNHEVNTYRLRQFPRPTVAFVGDDDQSIYAFRGSDVSVMRGLEKRFPGLEKKFLKTSYRCQPAILSTSNALVGVNTERYGKDLVPHDGAKHLGAIRVFHLKTPDDEITRLRKEAAAYMEDGGDPSEFAILTRTRDLAKAVAKGFRAAGLPVVEGKGSDLRKTAEVRDVMGFVTALTNTDAEVPLRRIINKPSRGLGPTSLRKVISNARKKNVSFSEEFATIVNDRIDVPDDGDAYKPAFIRSAKAFAHMMKETRKSADQAPDAPAALIAVMRGTGYLGDMYHNALKSAGLANREDQVRELEPKEFLQWLLKNNSDSSASDRKQDELLEGEDLADRASQVSEAARRIGNLALLVSEAEGFDTIDDFAQESVLEMNQVQAPAGIQVLTMHGSKGLEFDHVRLPFWVEGVMPHGRAADAGEHEVEEERRLAYVALTRGRLTTEVSRPKDVYNCPFIRQRHTRPSRFISEMEVAGKKNFRHASLKEDPGYLQAPVSKPREEAAVPPVSSLPVNRAEAASAQGPGASASQVPVREEAPVSYEERFSDSPVYSEEDFMDQGNPFEGLDGVDFDPGWDPRDGEEIPVDQSVTPGLPGLDDEREREDDPVPF